MKVNTDLLWDCRQNLTPDVLETESFKEMYIRRVLVRGTREDIISVGLSTIRTYLPRIPLPKDIRGFWEWFFEEGTSNVNS